MAVYSMESTQENCYPGSTVLVNKFGLTDQNKRSESEYKEYDCEIDNALLKGKMQILKNQYELK